MFLTLCVVVVTTSAWSKGDGIIFAATSPLMCAMSANRYAPLWSFARKVSVSYGQQSAECGGWEILTSGPRFRACVCSRKAASTRTRPRLTASAGTPWPGARTGRNRSTRCSRPTCRDCNRKVSVVGLCWAIYAQWANSRVLWCTYCSGKTC
jgi:hypothetical protein